MVLEPNGIQVIVHNFYERHGRWPLWASVLWRLAEQCDWPVGEADSEIVEAVRANEVIVELRGRWWVLRLDPAVQDAVVAWLALHAKEEAT